MTVELIFSQNPLRGTKRFSQIPCHSLANTRDKQHFYLRIKIFLYFCDCVRISPKCPHNFLQVAPWAVLQATGSHKPWHLNATADVRHCEQKDKDVPACCRSYNLPETSSLLARKDARLQIYSRSLNRTFHSTLQTLLHFITIVFLAGVCTASLQDGQ